MVEQGVVDGVVKLAESWGTLGILGIGILGLMLFLWKVISKVTDTYGNKLDKVADNLDKVSENIKDQTGILKEAFEKQNEKMERHFDRNNDTLREMLSPVKDSVAFIRNSNEQINTHLTNLEIDMQRQAENVRDIKKGRDK